MTIPVASTGFAPQRSASAPRNGATSAPTIVPIDGPRKNVARFQPNSVETGPTNNPTVGNKRPSGLTSREMKDAATTATLWRSRFALKCASAINCEDPLLCAMNAFSGTVGMNDMVVADEPKRRAADKRRMGHDVHVSGKRHRFIRPQQRPFHQSIALTVCEQPAFRRKAV